MRTVLVLVAIAASAHAHGPTPSGLEIVTSDADGPRFVKLSRGAAVWLDGRFEYVCESLWTSPETPQMASKDQVQTILAAHSGLHGFENGREVAALPSTAGDLILDANTVRRLVALDGAVYALTGFDADSKIWRVTDAGGVLVYDTEQTIRDLVVVDDALTIATQADDVLTILGLDGAGEAIGAPREIEGVTGSVFLRPAGSTLFLQTLEAGVRTLWRVTDDDALVAIAESKDNPFLGPIAAHDSYYVVAERALATIVDDAIVAIEDTKTVNCLGTLADGRPYVCKLPDMFLLEPGDAPFGAALFEIDALYPPDRSALEEPVTTECLVSWLDFATDAGLPVDGPEEDAGTREGAEVVVESEPPADCDCRQGPSPRRTGPFGPALLLILGLATLRRRSLKHAL